MYIIKCLSVQKKVHRYSDLTVVITGMHWHLTLVYNCEETPPDDGIMNTFVLALDTIAYFDGHRQYLMSRMCTRVHWGIPQDGGKATRVHLHVYVQLKVDASQLSLEREFSDDFADVSTECFCHHQGEWEEMQKHQHL